MDTRQPGPCIVCGETNYPLSFGGPAICPTCDCGSFNAKNLFIEGNRLRAKVCALEAENERLRKMLQKWFDGFPGGWLYEETEALLNATPEGSAVGNREQEKQL